MNNLYKIVAMISAVALSQNIYALHGEYFWNNDPGIDRATTITVEDSDGDGYCEICFPTENVPEGLNLLGLRVRYSSCWSTTTTALVWIPADNSGAVLASEYFFDKDPGIGKANPISSLNGSTDLLTEAVIPTEGLEPGKHLLGIRVKGAAGWSATTMAIINIVDNKLMSITAVEYYWSTDPDKTMPISITPGREVEISDLNVQFPEQDAEKYTLYFKAKTGEQWYQVYSKTFINELPTAIVLNEDALELEVGNSANLTVTTQPESALFTDYELISEDETIATVNSDGCVTAVAEGETNIIAASRRYPDINATCKVTVKDLSGISLVTDGRLTAQGVIGGILICSDRDGVKIYNTTGICIKTLDRCDNSFIAVNPGVYFVSSGDNVIKVLVNP